MIKRISFTGQHKDYETNIREGFMKEKTLKCSVCGVKNTWGGEGGKPILWEMERGKHAGELVCSDCLQKKHGKEKLNKMIDGTIEFEY